MPLTPFHFAPSTLMALPFRKYLDLWIFVLANIVIDLEPLVVMGWKIQGYPVHGLFHSFLVGGIVGGLWGLVAWKYQKVSKVILKKFGYTYSVSLKTALLSGFFGAWGHVILDAPLYTDIQPFWPLQVNPFLFTYDAFFIYTTSFCLSLILFPYLILRKRKIGKKRNLVLKSFIVLGMIILLLFIYFRISYKIDKALYAKPENVCNTSGGKVSSELRCQCKGRIFGVLPDKTVTDRPYVQYCVGGILKRIEVTPHINYPMFEPVK